MSTGGSAWAKSDWLVIDTETTGIDPTAARVVELAAVKFRNGEPTARHGMRLNPGIPIPNEATAIHKITDEDVRGNLPENGREASALVERERGRQRADYEAWKAKNAANR